MNRSKRILTITDDVVHFPWKSFSRTFSSSILKLKNNLDLIPNSRIFFQLYIFCLFLFLFPVCFFVCLFLFLSALLKNVFQVERAALVNANISICLFAVPACSFRWLRRTLLSLCSVTLNGAFGTSLWPIWQFQESNLGRLSDEHQCDPSTLSSANFIRGWFNDSESLI